MFVRNPEGIGRTTYEFLRGTGWTVKQIRYESDVPEREAKGYDESICKFEGRIDRIPLLNTWEHRGGFLNRTRGRSCGGNGISPTSSAIPGRTMRRATSMSAVFWETRFR